MKKIIFITLITLLTQYTLHSQWIVQQIPVNKPITGLEFVDRMKGWACTSSTQGDTCYLLHTTNGGLNWNIQFYLYDNIFDALDMVDDSIGYVSGYSFGTTFPFVYKTTNSGNNWNLITTGFGVDFDDLFFINADSGYMSGDLFIELYTTTNGGQTWQTRQNGIQFPPTRLYFLDYNTGWCGAQDRLYKTTNAGLNWNVISTFAQTVFAIQFKNVNTGWLGLSEGWVAYTTNSGQNWIYQRPYQFANIIPDIQYLTDSLGWAGEGFPRIYKTTNNGTNWIVQPDSGSPYNISMVDSLLGWTGRSKIARTTNGGLTYISSNTGTIPESYVLFQNYPNPFNPETTIKFSLTNSSKVQIKIYNILGKEMEIWKSEGLLPPGVHELRYVAINTPSGVYFYKIDVSGKKGDIIYTDTKKMILVR